MKKLWLLVIPCLALMSVNAFIPIFALIHQSMYRMIPGLRHFFVGWDNFKYALNYPSFLMSIGRTLLFSAEALAIEIPLGLGLAYAVRGKGKFTAVFTVLIAIPLLIPWMQIGVMAKIFTRAGVGLIPNVASFFGISYSLADPIWAFQTLVFMDVWHWVGLVFIIILAGLEAMPQEPIQAAKIDGASRWDIFRYIELPSLRWPLLIAILLRFMDLFKIYAEPWMLTQGGPQDATRFLSIEIVRTVMGKGLYGRAAAMSLIVLYIVLVISFILYVFFQEMGE